ncbi:MAG: nucleotidyltransferase domain-containing protein [Solirubrobacteraceae bacterium]
MPTLDRTERAQLDDVLGRMVAEFEPERIYLYGSRARGDTRPGSDWDLMVIVSSSVEPGYRRDQRAIRALGTVPFPAHVTVWTADEFDSRRHLVASFPATIEREGELLYTR